MSDADALDLSKDNTIATALSFSHFYLSWNVDPKKRNVFSFKIVKSKQIAIFIGIQEVIHSHWEVQYLSQWRVNLKDGKKFEEQKSKKNYLTCKIKQGDVINVIIQHGYIVYEVNGKNYGVAFHNEKLKGPHLKAFAYMGSGD